MSNQHIDFLPKGSVIMWYGDSTEVPNGWAICDGHDNSKFGGNVPDLRGRFVVGANSDDSKETYGRGRTGGAETVTLSISQMPSHNHEGKTHEVDINKSDNNGENHKLMAPQTYSRGFSGGDYAGYDRGSGGIEKELKHCIHTRHEHRLSIENKGEGQSHENRPPYYALYYIIKVTDGIQ